MEEEIHGHEVLAMMEGKSFTVESLRKAIIDRFGTNQLFYTCRASGLTADGLIQFLIDNGKFVPQENESFVVNKDNICNH